MERLATDEIPTSVPLDATSPNPDEEGGGGSSPSGLVVLAENALWKVNAKGQLEPLLEVEPGASSFQLSPDGFQVLYDAIPASGEGYENDLWLVDLATGDSRNLTQNPGRDERCALWWPARPTVVVFSYRVEGSFECGRLVALDLQSGDSRTLLEDTISSLLPAPSPDGRTIAFTDIGNAWLYRWEEGEAESLDPARFGLTVEKFFDLAATSAAVLHTYEPVGCEALPEPPVWSPDGRWIAYTVYCAEGMGVYVLRPDEPEEHYLGTGGSPPIWSPDGRWLAFKRGFKEDEGVWIASTQDWTLQQVTGPGARVVGWPAMNR